MAFLALAVFIACEPADGKAVRNTATSINTNAQAVAWLRSSLVTNRRAARACQQERFRARTVADHAERSSNVAYLGWARRLWKSRHATCEKKLALDKRRWKWEPVAYAKQVARYLLARRGWSSQYGCLNSIIMHESSWHVDVPNRSGSGAYGIPQSLPGSKMASMGADWRTSPLTQIRWMLSYLRGRYGDPCGGWSHWQRFKSY